MLRVAFRWLLALFFVVAGGNHFRVPQAYVAVMPPYLPEPLLLVYVSGIAEILGGVGVLVAPVRRWAGIGLIALLVAVFPANIYMATGGALPPNLQVAPWVLWARLPLQAVLIAWVWWVTLRRDDRNN